MKLSHEGRTNNMKYFINGKPATEAEATAQEERNRQIMEIEDPKEWLKAATGIGFITIIGERG
jgi:hypothetical protein